MRVCRGGEGLEGLNEGSLTACGQKSSFPSILVQVVHTGLFLRPNFIKIIQVGVARPQRPLEVSNFV